MKGYKLEISHSNSMLLLSLVAWLKKKDCWSICWLSDESSFRRDFSITSLSTDWPLNSIVLTLSDACFRQRDCSLFCWLSDSSNLLSPRSLLLISPASIVEGFLLLFYQPHPVFFVMCNLSMIIYSSSEQNSLNKIDKSIYSLDEWNP